MTPNDYMDEFIEPNRMMQACDWERMCLGSMQTQCDVIIWTVCDIAETSRIAIFDREETTTRKTFVEALPHESAARVAATAQLYSDVVSRLEAKVLELERLVAGPSPGGKATRGMLNTAKKLGIIAHNASHYREKIISIRHQLDHLKAEIALCPPNGPKSERKRLFGELQSLRNMIGAGIAHTGGLKDTITNLSNIVSFFYDL